MIIAGASEHIDVASAVKIGMFSPVALDSFNWQETLSTKGRNPPLSHFDNRIEGKEISCQIGYIELAKIPYFGKTFARTSHIG